MSLFVCLCEPTEEDKYYYSQASHPKSSAYKFETFYFFASEYFEYVSIAHALQSMHTAAAICVCVCVWMWMSEGIA